MKHNLFAALACATFLANPALAQDHTGHSGHEIPQGNSQDMDHHMHHQPMGEGGKICTVPWHAPDFAAGSGTSRLPGWESRHSAPHGDPDCAPDQTWKLMTHGFVSAQYTDHSGPRGDDQLYVTSMAMLTGSRQTDWGTIELKSMFSLEPLMDARGYPNLFATGETADGEALVDRQHPHDLFMELAARVDVNIGDSGSLFLYGGPVGEPALGPSAFMHRGSAALNPEPPITHHWFDSTHITYGVVTAGYSAPKFQLEASTFRGAEPDEERWGIETPKFNSWSVRGTLTPSPNWALQASYGEIDEPEALHPGEDEHRFTTSAHYNNGKGLSAMLAFSSKKRVEAEGHIDDADEEHGSGALTAWLAEVNWDVDHANTMFARFENVANDELFPDHDDPLHDETFRESKFQAGYARRIRIDPFTLAIGGSGNFYAKPDALDAAYGDSPWGYTLFIRLMLGH